MNIDVTQFHQNFFEESLEGLDIMESILLQTESGDSDDEDINSIFRVAHSIKGGAGTFGFAQISEFTHVQETLLDEIRLGNRKMVPEIVSLLLTAVDKVREMISICQSKDEIPLGMGQEIVVSLKNILENAVDAGSVDAGSVDAGSVDAGSVDAGSVDAGSVNAGSVDAGSVNAGSVNAGSVNAGSVNAGSIDRDGDQITENAIVPVERKSCSDSCDDRREKDTGRRISDSGATTISIRVGTDKIDELYGW